MRLSRAARGGDRAAPPSSCCSNIPKFLCLQVRAEVEEAARLREHNKRGVKRALQV